jgi:hypothetical protein
LYAHRAQADRASRRGPGVESPAYPPYQRPDGVPHSGSGASLCRGPIHSDSRSGPWVLEAAASAEYRGPMHGSANGLLRIHLLGRWVNEARVRAGAALGPVLTLVGVCIHQRRASPYGINLTDAQPPEFDALIRVYQFCRPINSVTAAHVYDHVLGQGRCRRSSVSARSGSIVPVLPWSMRRDFGVLVATESPCEATGKEPRLAIPAPSGSMQQPRAPRIRLPGPPSAR